MSPMDSLNRGAMWTVQRVPWSASLLGSNEPYYLPGIVQVVSSGTCSLLVQYLLFGCVFSSRKLLVGPKRRPSSSFPSSSTTLIDRYFTRRRARPPRLPRYREILSVHIAPLRVWPPLCRVAVAATFLSCLCHVTLPFIISMSEKAYLIDKNSKFTTKHTRFGPSHLPFPPFHFGFAYVLLFVWFWFGFSLGFRLA